MSPANPSDHPAPRQVRQVIERLVRDGTVVARSDGTVHHLFPVAIGGAEGEALRDWVTRESATRTIEIGLGYGISALFACQGLLRNGDPAASHVVVDPYQATRFGNCGLQVLEEAGLASLVEHHEEESQIALPRFLAEGRRFDLAFVDGNHRFDGIFVDLTYLGRLLRPGAIVLVDDYQLPAIARAASFFVTNLNWTLEEVSPVDELHQWAALRNAVVRRICRVLTPWTRAQAAHVDAPPDQLDHAVPQRKEDRQPLAEQADRPQQQKAVTDR